MGAAHGGLRPLRLDDRAPVRDGRAAARLSRDARELRTDLFRKPTLAASGAGAQLSLF